MTETTERPDDGLFWGLILVLVLAFAFAYREGPKPSVAPAPAPATPEPKPAPRPCPPNRPCPLNDVQAAMVDAHNKARADAGRPPLRPEARLTKAAQAHADYMARTGRFEHFGIGDGDPWSRAKDAGYPFTDMRDVNENIALGARDAAQAVSDWMQSSGHRRTLMGPYAEIGCGMATGAAGNYWCATFGTPNVPPDR